MMLHFSCHRFTVLYMSKKLKRAMINVLNLSCSTVNKDDSTNNTSRTAKVEELPRDAYSENENGL
jgi:hypothetical protein